MKNLTSFDDHIDKKYGKRGTKKREEFESEYKNFKLGVLIRQAREGKNLSQTELAEKAHTNKSYISRIENDASDIRLSTLRKIIEKGLGGKLRVSVEL